MDLTLNGVSVTSQFLEFHNKMFLSFCVYHSTCLCFLRLRYFLNILDNGDTGHGGPWAAVDARTAGGSRAADWRGAACRLFGQTPADVGRGGERGTTAGWTWHVSQVCTETNTQSMSAAGAGRCSMDLDTGERSSTLSRFVSFPPLWLWEETVTAAVAPRFTLLSVCQASRCRRQERDALSLTLRQNAAEWPHRLTRRRRTLCQRGREEKVRTFECTDGLVLTGRSPRLLLDVAAHGACCTDEGIQ